MNQLRTNKIIFTPVLFFFIFYLSIHPLSTIFPLNISNQNNSNAQVRIYCLILTSPEYFDSRARAVNSTWAPRCDGYSFISEYSNDTKGLPIASIGNLSAGYWHLTLKTTLAFHYVYKHLLNDYDWFVKADDDTYLFVENLKLFLKEQNTSEPITFGYNFKVWIFINKEEMRNLFQ
jgi:glycoprotein-N-acetylgalactosamine 3-beta-galactosyltransferase